MTTSHCLIVTVPATGLVCLAPDSILLSKLINSFVASPQEYAEKIRAYAYRSNFKSLYSGHRFVALANFLWRPYEHRATRLDYSPAIASQHHEPSAFAMILNWQERCGNKIKRLSSINHLKKIDKIAVNLVALKGYPTAEWLNALGAKYRIDPEFYQRHLCFWSESGNNISRHNIAPRLPSSHAQIVMLRITTIGVLTGRSNATQRASVQDQIDYLRRKTSKDMAAYISRLSSLDCPEIAPGDSVVREFVMLDLNHFAIEQIITINITPNNNGGWLSK